MLDYASLSLYLIYTLAKISDSESRETDGAASCPAVTSGTLGDGEPLSDGVATVSLQQHHKNLFQVIVVFLSLNIQLCTKLSPLDLHSGG